MREFSHLTLGALNVLQFAALPGDFVGSDSLTFGCSLGHFYLE
jgi:hypothetical protein